MAYNDVAEADVALGHVALWTALTDEAAKQRVLDVAALWLRATYVLPVAPTAVELVAIKGAELAAVEYHLVQPLFGQPGAAEKGAVIRERVKVDAIEEEFQYATPETARSGPAIVPEADAWLTGIAVRRDAVSSMPVAFVV